MLMPGFTHCVGIEAFYSVNEALTFPKLNRTVSRRRLWIIKYLTKSLLYQPFVSKVC